jgi:molybdopterin adenylyltransferase
VISLIKAGILTASDRSSEGKREDQSGALLKSLISTLPAEVVAYRIVPDEKEALIKNLVHLTDLFHCDLVLTTGGTGIAPRDVTPEATRSVIEKEMPGIAEAIREESRKKTPFAMLSRAVAGMRGQSLIINLPGSPRAIEEVFEVLRPILPHALALIKGEVLDCQKSTRLSHSHSS